MIYPKQVPYVPEKNVHSAVFGWKALYRSIKSTLSNMLFKASVSLLIFCLDDLSIDVCGVLKSPTIIALLSIYPFMSVNIYAPNIEAPQYTRQILTAIKGESGVLKVLYYDCVDVDFPFYGC